MFEKVLFPVDTKLNIAKIMDNAVFLKKFNIRYLDLLYVECNHLSNHDTTKERLNDMAESVRKKTACQVGSRLADGQAATKIVSIAKADDYDLIFIPSNNKGIMTRTLLGNTVSDVIRMTDTPTLIYKRFSDQPQAWRTVVFATDFQEAAEKSLTYVRDLGQVALRLIILHVGQRSADPKAEESRIKLVDENLNGLKDRLSPDWREISAYHQVGPAAYEIHAYADRFHADLIVMGRSNATLLKKLLGSTAERVANLVKSSVLLIP